MGNIVPWNQISKSNVDSLKWFKTREQTGASRFKRSLGINSTQRSLFFFLGKPEFYLYCAIESNHSIMFCKGCVCRSEDEGIYRQQLLSSFPNSDTTKERQEKLAHVISAYFLENNL
jgi:hypothetical protein